jgi:tripartite-type tricarboxylate transporter receptor subunit TctC
MKLLSYFGLILFSGLFFIGSPNSANAVYPKKAVTIVSPYGPGGAADMAARIMSATAPGMLGKSIMVINRAGASGVTGSTYVAKSKPDGYTLLMARVGCQAAVPAMNRKIPYKWDDFTFLGLLEHNPFVVVVPEKSPYKNFNDLKKALKSGKKLSYSSAGVGTLPHLGMVVFLDKLGVTAAAHKHIPFKGGGAAAAAVSGGHVDILFQNLSGLMGGIRSGQLRALAITSAKRAATVPTVPTFRELGHSDMEVILGWSGLWGPKNLPDEVVKKWTGILQKLKNDKGWNKMTKGLGSVPMIMNPADTKAFVKVQYETFKDVTERLGMTIK